MYAEYHTFDEIRCQRSDLNVFFVVLVFVPASKMEIVLLSGEYTNKTVLEWRNHDIRHVDILLRGQRDCFPLPANVTQCNSHLPSINSILGPL